MSNHKLYDIRNRDRSPRHRETHRRYEIAYTVNDLFAGLAFTVGSVFFFYDSLMEAGTWLFLLGSISFLARPLIRLVRELHLSRL